LRLVQAGAVALALGLVHGAVGGLEQIFRIFGMLRVEGDADTRGNKIDVQ